MVILESGPLAARNGSVRDGHIRIWATRSQERLSARWPRPDGLEYHPLLRGLPDVSLHDTCQGPLGIALHGEGRLDGYAIAAAGQTHPEGRGDRGRRAAGAARGDGRGG